MIAQPRHLLRTKSRKSFCLERRARQGNRVQEGPVKGEIKFNCGESGNENNWRCVTLDVTVFSHAISRRRSSLRETKFLLLGDHGCWKRAASMALPKLSWVNVISCPACEVWVEVLPSKVTCDQGGRVWSHVTSKVARGKFSRSSSRATCASRSPRTRFAFTSVLLKDAKSYACSAVY